MFLVPNSLNVRTNAMGAIADQWKVGLVKTMLVVDYHKKYAAVAAGAYLGPKDPSLTILSRSSEESPNHEKWRRAHHPTPSCNHWNRREKSIYSYSTITMTDTETGRECCWVSRITRIIQSESHTNLSSKGVRHQKIFFPKVTCLVNHHFREALDFHTYCFCE